VTSVWKVQDVHLLAVKKRYAKIFVVIVLIRLTFCIQMTKWTSLNVVEYRTQWPRDLRHGSAAAGLLESPVRFLPQVMDVYLVSVVCCQVEVSATGRSLV